jgi:hypothetical protein
MFNWMHPKTLAISSNYHERKIRESLEINYAQTFHEIKRFPPLLNRDNGVRIASNSWRPLFKKIIQKSK